MRETPGRLLRLLSLLQLHRDWSGIELAGRLGVTTRTVRRDGCGTASPRWKRACCRCRCGGRWWTRRC